MTTAREMILALPLKEADPSLLTHYILGWAEGDPRVTEALELASYLHRDQTRTNRGSLPRDNYITHPLRNAVRLIRYGVTDKNIIIATILHDTVEDCAFELSKTFYGKTSDNPHGARIRALRYLKQRFGFEVSEIVRQVSNPLYEKKLSKAEKVEAYLEHVKNAIYNDAEVFLVKFTDWVDNGVGLAHNDVPGNEGMITHLSDKYYRLSLILYEELHGNEHAIMQYLSDEGSDMLVSHYHKGAAILGFLTSKASI